MKKNAFYVVILLTFVLVLSGCGEEPQQSTPGDNQSDKLPETVAKDNFPDDPVTLTVWNQAAGILNDDDLETFLGKPVRNKYPNIAFQLVTDMKLEDMIASGQIPDLITTSNYYLYGLIDLRLTDDLSTMIKQESIDMQRFEPAVTDALQLFGNNGEVYGMPFALNYGVTVYNRSIFDKFGVSFPEDGMTWDEMIELSQRVTRTEGADEYIGLDPGAVQTLVRARSLPVMDENREQANINTEPIKDIFNLFHKLYSIPGVVTNGGERFSYGYNFFQNDQKLAMLPYWLAALTSRVPALNEAGVDWDIVSYPTFKDRPEYGREVDFHLVAVTSTSKHKEVGYKALSALVTDEAQRAMNSNVRLTVLNNPELRAEFASDLQYYADKNLDGVFSVNPAPLAMTSEHDDKIYANLRAAITKMVRENMDINTALREAEEESNKYIQEQKNQ